MENQTIMIENKGGKAVLRILSLLILFFGAYVFVQSVLVAVQYIDYQQNTSFLAVILYLLPTPFVFVASLLVAVGIHSGLQGKNVLTLFTIAYGMLVLSAVANLLYFPVHFGSNGTTFEVLWGIVLICYLILFIYMQGMENKAMVFVAGVLLIGSAALELEEAIRYFASIQTWDLTGYYFTIKSLYLLIAIFTLLFALFVKKGVVQKKDKLTGGRK